MGNIKFIGIDISKATLDIYDEISNKHSKIKNDVESIRKFFEPVDHETIIVYESTGVYGKNLEKVLNDLGKNHYLIHANHASALGRTLIGMNKTDKLDAHMLVQIAKVIYNHCNELGGKSKFIKPNSNQINQIQVHLTSIRFMKDQLKGIKQQIEYYNMNPYDSSIELKMAKQMITKIEENIQTLEDKVMEIYKELELFEKYEKIKTIPGIGPVCAMELINFFLFLTNKGFQRDDKKQVVAYAGIHPVSQESGTSIHGSKLSNGGKREVKTVLFMSGMQWQKRYKYDKYKETVIGKFTNRMIDKFRSGTNKRGKSVACAVGKKLLIVARAIFRDDSTYNFA